MQSNLTFKFLRVLSIVLLVITTAFTLLGGAGTTCVAFNAEAFGASMASLVPVKPVFQVLVVISLAAALYGAYATFRLARGRHGAYHSALLFLVVAGTASAIQFYFSLTLRGSTAPNNFRLYTTLLTLAVLLVLRLPGIWQKVGLEQGGTAGSFGKPAGLGMLAAGLLTLAMPVWGAPTHVINGVNTVNVLLAPLMTLGTLLCAGGILLLFGQRRHTVSRAQPSVYLTL